MKNGLYQSPVIKWLLGAAFFVLIVLYMVLPDGRESQLPLLHFTEGFVSGLVIVNCLWVVIKRIWKPGRDDSGKI